MWPDRDGRGGGLYRVQQLGAGDEHHAGARQRQKPSAEAGVGLKIEPAALHRAQRDGIDHQPRLEARLDREQPANLAEQCTRFPIP